jgi:hypothetical protein
MQVTYWIIGAYKELSRLNDLKVVALVPRSAERS